MEKQKQESSSTIINADSLVLGRMSTYIAKRLLKGERIIVVNAEKAILSGKKASKVGPAKEFLEVGAPMRGPFHYRRPDKIVRIAVRGMLPFREPKGKEAYRKLSVCIGIPDEFKDRKMEVFEDAHSSKLTCPYITVSQFAKEIGWTGE